MRHSGEQRATLFISLAGAFLMPFMVSSVNVSMPAIGREFTASAITLSGIATAYLLTTAICLLPLGRLADIFGQKRVFLCGIAGFTLTSLLCALAPSISVLIAFRGLQGIAAAMIFGTGVAILSVTFPPGERGRVLGLNIATVYVGLALGPFLGGALTQHFGWRSVFWFSAPLGLVVTVIILLFMRREPRDGPRESFDLAGSLVYAAALLAAFYGFSSLPSVRGAVCLPAGLAGLGVFVWLEARVHSPVLNIALFRHNRVFVCSSIAALINYSATYAVSFLLSLYLQYVKGYSPQTAGLILICQPATQALFSPFAGRLSDRVEPRKIATLGMLLTAIGLLLMVFLREQPSLPFLIAALLLLGVGFALFSSPNTNAIMGSVEQRHYGVASGFLGTMRLTGQMLSMGITTLVFALVIGADRALHDHVPLFAKSVGVIFGILAALAVTGIFFSLARGGGTPAVAAQRKGVAG